VKCTTPKHDEQHLNGSGKEPDNQEKWVLENVVEDINLAVDFAAVKLIKQLHPYKTLKTMV
jgi:hypothetical protein